MFLQMMHDVYITEKRMCSDAYQLMHACQVSSTKKSYFFICVPAQSACTLDATREKTSLKACTSKFCMLNVLF